MLFQSENVADNHTEFAEYTSAQERIALGKKAKKVEARKKKEQMRVAVEEMFVARFRSMGIAHGACFSGEDDEEEMEWEQEQLRRGGHREQTPETTVPIKAVYKPAPSKSIHAPAFHLLDHSTVPPITPIPTLDPAIARLTQSLTTLTTSHAQNTSSMASLAEEQLQLEAKEKELRQMIENTEARRSWFVAFREWVEGVASFLDEKVGPSFLPL